MPYVTQSRTVPLPPWPWHYVRRTGYGQGAILEERRGNATSYSTTQQTYSFRTGKGLQSEEAAYEGMTGEELRSNIRTEYQTRYDNGHEFWTNKVETSISHPHAVMTRLAGLSLHRYEGPIWPGLGGANTAPTVTIPSDSQKDLDGTKLFNSVVPTKQELQLAAILGELRQGLPSLVGFSFAKTGMFLSPKMRKQSHVERRKTYHERIYDSNKASRVNGRFVKNWSSVSSEIVQDRYSVRGRDLASASGQEVLNHQFAVLPTINDVKNVAAGVVDLQRRINQYTRDSDKNVRRRITLDEDAVQTEIANQVSSLAYGDALGNPSTLYFNSLPRTRVFDVIQRRKSFSGAFTYHVSQGNSFLDRMPSYAAKANHLLGLDLSPEAIWQLTPWSWLIDWFADVDTFISNVTALHTDNLVLRYGYVMHQVEATRHRTIAGLNPIAGVSPSTVSLFCKRTYKSRRRSTPYGFGVNVDALSARRWAILGALGITKSSNSLRFRE